MTNTKTVCVRAVLVAGEVATAESQTGGPVPSDRGREKAGAVHAEILARRSRFVPPCRARRINEILISPDRNRNFCDGEHFKNRTHVAAGRRRTICDSGKKPPRNWFQPSQREFLLNRAPMAPSSGQCRRSHLRVRSAAVDPGGGLPELSISIGRRT